MDAAKEQETGSAPSLEEVSSAAPGLGHNQEGEVLPPEQVFGPTAEYTLIAPADGDPYKLDALGAKLTDIFGGVTSYRAMGGWRAPDGKLIVERVLVFRATDFNVEEPAAADRQDAIIRLAREAKTAFNQECVYLTRAPGAGALIQ